MFHLISSYTFDVMTCVPYDGLISKFHVRATSPEILLTRRHCYVFQGLFQFSFIPFGVLFDGRKVSDRSLYPGFWEPSFDLFE